MEANEITARMNSAIRERYSRFTIPDFEQSQIDFIDGADTLRSMLRIAEAKRERIKSGSAYGVRDDATELAHVESRIAAIQKRLSEVTERYSRYGVPSAKLGEINRIDDLNTLESMLEIALDKADAIQSGSYGRGGWTGRSDKDHAIELGQAEAELKAIRARIRELTTPAKYGKVFNHATGKWEESKHPRDQGGKFTSKGAEGGGAAQNHPAAEAPEKPPAPSNKNTTGKPSAGAQGPQASPQTAQESFLQRTPPPNVDPRAVEAADKAIAAYGEPTPENVAAYVEAVTKHPYYQAAVAKLDAAAKQTKSGNATMWSKERYSTPDGQYTPERKALHEKIIKSMLNPNATQKRGKSGKPVAVLLMGPPGSGKTTAGQPAVAGLGFNLKQDFTIINADDVKSALPEYQGWNAGLLHEESSDVAEKELTNHALDAQHNTLFDLTGANGEKMSGMVDNLAARGYEVHMISVTLPSNKVSQRVWNRFRENAFGSKDPAGEPGRFVPPNYAYLHVDSKPDKTYAALKNHPAVQSWTQISTDVPYGKPPIVKDQGSR